MKILKNRKAMIAFILCACLIMGIGYANLVDNLTVDGKLRNQAGGDQKVFDNSVHFVVGDSTAANSGGVTNVTNCTAAVYASTPDIANMIVDQLAIAGEKATATFTIINEGNVAAEVSAPEFSFIAGTGANTPALLEEYFNIETDWGTAKKTLGANATQEVTVTVTLKKNLTTTLEGAFTLDFEVNSVTP